MNALLVELLEMLVRGGLLLAVAYAGSFALRSAGAALQSCYWRVAILAVLLLPVVPALWTLERAALPIEPPVKFVLVETEPAPGRAPIPPEVRPQEVVEPAVATSIARQEEAVPPVIEKVSPVSPAPDLAASDGGVDTRWIVAAVCGIWLSGALFVFGRWGAAALRFRRLWRQAVPAGDSGLVDQFRQIAGELGLPRTPQLMTHRRIAVPMAGGLLRARVLLPNDCARWPEEDRRMVVLHELVHVKRRDALFHLLSSLVKALHWMNPLAWVVVRSVRASAECATDDRVLEDGSANPSYARLLVDFASRQMASSSPSTPAVASSMAQPDTVESRVRRILDSGQRRARPGGIVVMLIVGGFAGLLGLVGGIVFADDRSAAAAAVDEAIKADAKSQADLRKRLDEITVESVSFSEATMAEAVQFCIRKSVEADPAGDGLNMIMIGAPGVPDGLGDEPAPRLNLQLRNIPLSELLRYMGLLSGMKLDVEPHSIVFRPRSMEGGELYSKVFPLSAALIGKAMEGIEVGGAWGDDDPFATADDLVDVAYEPTARDWLSTAGVQFPDGSSALYEPLSGKLIVRNTQWELGLVEEIVKSLQGLKPPDPPSPDAMRAKLRSIMIPELDLDEATLDEVVEFLRVRSGEEGMNLVVFGGGGKPLEGSPRTITLKLKNIPFDVALDYITETLSYSYRVEPHAVVLSPGYQLRDVIGLRTFPIKSRQLQQRFEASPGTAKEWLQSLGVMFYNGTSAYFERAGKNLIIRSSSQQIGLVEDALASIPEDAGLPAPDVGEASAVPVPAPDLLMGKAEGAARQAVILFHHADTIEKRLAHVRDPNRVKPLMEEWYAENEPMVDLTGRKNIPVAFGKTKVIEDHGRRFVILSMSVADSGVRIYAVEETDGGMKLDWETAVGYQQMPLEKFKEERPTTALPFRVKVKPGDYYNYGFRDEAKFRCVELSYPGRPEFRLFGYIDRSRESAQELIGQLDMGLAPSLIVNLKYPGGEIRDDKQVVLDSIVAETWWPPAPAGGGDAAGAADSPLYGD